MSTNQEILRHLRNQAERKLGAWQKAAASDPMHALEWLTRDAVEGATVIEACAVAATRLEKDPDLDLRAFAIEQAAARSRFPPASTGLLDATISAYRAAAWSAIADALRLG